MNNKFKVFVFFQYAALGVWGPYLPLFLYRKQFSGIQIGLLLGTMPILVMILQPVWSYLSDRLNTRRNLLLISSLGMGLTMVGVGLAETFFIAFMWTILFSAFWAPLTPVSTAMLLESLEETGDLDKFSLVRLWGSVGFGIASLLVGSLFLGQVINYLTWLTGGLYFLLGLVSQFLPEKRGELVFPEVKASQILSGNPRLVFFLLASVFIGATFGVYINYITLFLQSLNAQDWLVGLTVSLQAFVEVPLMLLVPLTLRHRSPRWIILAGALLLPLRWLFYFLVQAPGWVAPVQLIHGVAVVSFFVIGVGYIDQLVNPRWRATGQGLYAAAFGGIGNALGIYMAGVVFELFDIRSVWVLNIILGLIGLGLLLVSFKCRQQDQDHLSMAAVEPGVGE
jgi:PPP family 3-phenylpropionic acid transporter